MFFKDCEICKDNNDYKNRKDNNDCKDFNCRKEILKSKT